MDTKNAIRRCFLFPIIIISLIFILSACNPNSTECPFEYKKVPAGNPLKGLLPFMGSYSVPHSMEWKYIPLSDVMNGYNSFTWETGLEPVLNEIASRGNQAVIRIYIDYPGKPLKLPKFLLDAGVKLFPYPSFGGGQNPDYNDEKLITALENLIIEFGKKYDGDARIAFITCGLIGHWGEWHTHPDDDKMASAKVQNRILLAYDNSFNKTKLLARNPETVAKLNIGIHDDSFLEDTLVEKPWGFMSTMAAANTTEKWKTEPIGGEIYPEYQDEIWTENSPISSDFIDKCLETTHASWMTAYHVFEDYIPGTDQYNRAMESSRKMGYDLYVTKFQLYGPLDRKIKIDFTIGNKGIAPFYYDWEVDIGIANDKNKLLSTGHTTCKLSSILPGTFNTTSFEINISNLQHGKYKILLKVSNPLVNGKPLLFSNSEQNKDIKNWLTLGLFENK